MQPVSKQTIASSDQKDGGEAAQIPPSNTAEKCNSKRSFDLVDNPDTDGSEILGPSRENMIADGSTVESAIDADAWEAPAKKTRIRVKGTHGTSRHDPIGVDPLIQPRWSNIFGPPVGNASKRKVNAKRKSARNSDRCRDFWFGPQADALHPLSNPSLIVVKEWQRECEPNSPEAIVRTSVRPLQSLGRTSPDVAPEGSTLTAEPSSPARGYPSASSYSAESQPKRSQREPEIGEVAGERI